MSSINFCDGIEDVHPHPVPDINVAELTGICKALDIANENGIQKIKIHTDSKTSIKLINLISVNRAKGIRSKTYSKCPEIIESILRLSEKIDTKLIKVKSHDKKRPCLGNNEADELCDRALQKIGCGKIKKKNKMIKKKRHGRKIHRT